LCPTPRWPTYRRRCGGLSNQRTGLENHFVHLWRYLMIPAWIRSLLTRPVTRTIRKRHRSRLALEVLEVRTLLSVTVGQNFPDINFNQTSGGTPPDTMMAVGPTTVLGAVNTALVLKSKTGATIAAPTEFSSFFASIVRPGDLFSDPYV